jgi:hypothetical protein
VSRGRDDRGNLPPSSMATRYDDAVVDPPAWRVSAGVHDQQHQVTDATAPITSTVGNGMMTPSDHHAGRETGPR